MKKNTLCKNILLFIGLAPLFGAVNADLPDILAVESAGMDIEVLYKEGQISLKDFAEWVDHKAGLLDFELMDVYEDKSDVDVKMQQNSGQGQENVVVVEPLEDIVAKAAAEIGYNSQNSSAYDGIVEKPDQKAKYRQANADGLNPSVDRMCLEYFEACFNKGVSDVYSEFILDPGFSIAQGRDVEKLVEMADLFDPDFKRSFDEAFDYLKMHAHFLREGVNWHTFGVAEDGRYKLSSHFEFFIENLVEEVLAVFRGALIRMNIAYNLEVQRGQEVGKNDLIGGFLDKFADPLEIYHVIQGGREEELVRKVKTYFDSQGLSFDNRALLLKSLREVVEGINVFDIMNGLGLVPTENSWIIISQNKAYLMCLLKDTQNDYSIIC